VNALLECMRIQTERDLKVLAVTPSFGWAREERASFTLDSILISIFLAD
jgi:hypothetical protein